MKPFNIYSTILASAFLIITTSAFSQNALAVEGSKASGQHVAVSKVVIQVKV